MTKSTYLKTAGLIATAAFATTLAVLIGDRLSTEAMAVLAGAVCGVTAAIPTSLLILTITQRHQACREGTLAAGNTTPPQEPRYTQPVVFTVPPMPIQPPPTPAPATWGDLSAQLGAPTPRHFTIVGEMPDMGHTE